jgi:hypothetical protein
VLQHAASVLPAGSHVTSAAALQSKEGGEAGGTTAAPTAACISTPLAVNQQCTASASSSPVDQPGITDSSSTDAGCPLSAESMLLVLQTACMILSACWETSRADETAHQVVSSGLQYASSSRGSSTTGSAPAVSSGTAAQACMQTPHDATAPDDLVPVLDAVLSLSAAFVSDGPWWQEAKAQDPLELISTLYLTAEVSKPSGCLHCCPNLCRSELDNLLYQQSGGPAWGSKAAIATGEPIIMVAPTNGRSRYRISSTGCDALPTHRNPVTHLLPNDRP